MAGIGFVLRRLAQQDTLNARVRAYAHAASVSSGPWLFTVVCLGGVQMLARSMLSQSDVQLFSIIIVYNFGFSLVISGPVVLVVTRRLADRIYAKDVSEAPGTFIGALALISILELIPGLAFYGGLADLRLSERIAALVNFLLVGDIWLACAFLSALQSFGTISAAFALGMAVGFGGALLLANDFGPAGMLTGFTAGLATIFFGLSARIFAEYAHPVKRPLGFLDDFRRYWEFALVGLFYNAAIWVDKWVMWFAPGRIEIAGALRAHPAYDAAMFFAYLSIVPAMTVLLVSIETQFFERYVRFYRGIEAHATASEIWMEHRAILRVLGQGATRIVVLQAVTSYLAILVAPGLIGMDRGGQEMVPIYRFGTLGALFHVLLLATMAIISYFDLRRELLAVSAVFLVLNFAFTLASLHMGLGYYGYGYFLAALVTCLFAMLLASSRIARLPYMTFIANNQGLR
jgi:uncharacterized membrane protein